MPTVPYRFQTLLCSRLAGWRDGHRRARFLLRAQREGLPQAGEEGLLDPGRIRLTLEMLEALRSRGFVKTYRGRSCALLRLPRKGSKYQVAWYSSVQCYSVFSLFFTVSIEL